MGIYSLLRDMSSNSLSGSIPPSLGKLNKLITLDLGNSNLSGHLVHELGKLEHLQYLTMWKHTLCKQVSGKFRSYSRIAPPPPAYAQRVIRVSNNISQLGSPKDGPKPRQLLSLPPFPGHPLPGKSSLASHVTVISWVKYYFDEILDSVIQSHFNKGLVHIECQSGNVSIKQGGKQTSMIKVKPNDVMEVGARVHIPVSVAETKISKRFDTIPSGTLYPNADEIEYLQRLVKYKDTDILVLNKPPRLPVKGNLPVHNSMDALAAAALCYDYDEGPKLVQRLDKESSGLLLMGRTKESIGHLEWLFNDVKKSSSWCKPMMMERPISRIRQDIASAKMSHQLGYLVIQNVTSASASLETAIIRPLQ